MHKVINVRVSISKKFNKKVKAASVSCSVKKVFWAAIELEDQGILVLVHISCSCAIQMS